MSWKENYVKTKEADYDRDLSERFTKAIVVALATAACGAIIEAVYDHFVFDDEEETEED